MKFYLKKKKCPRNLGEFKGLEAFYANYEILKPDSFCCRPMFDNWEYVSERSDGGTFANSIVLGLEMYTNPETGSRIRLNFCPSYGQPVTFEVIEDGS